MRYSFATRYGGQPSTRVFYDEVVDFPMTEMQINDDSDLGSVQIVDLELVNLAQNHDKFYHAYLLFDQPIKGKDERFHVLIHYGRNGTHGQTDLKSFASPGQAERQYRSKVTEKLDKGYTQIGRERIEKPIPSYILDRAKITPAFDRNHIQTAYDILRDEIGRAVVYATGTPDELDRAMRLRPVLDEKLTELAVKFEEMRGQLEVLDMLLVRNSR